MVCCVKQAATGESPVGRGHNRKVGKEGRHLYVYILNKTSLCHNFFQLLARKSNLEKKLYLLKQILS
jgi:hypothetical protein